MFPLIIKIVKRSALAPNSQAGVERANSTYNIFKNELTASMKLPIIQARLRIKINGPLSTPEMCADTGSNKDMKLLKR